MSGQADDAGTSRVRDAVASQLDRAVDSIQWIEAGIGLRQFARVTLVGEQEPRSVIARIEAPEDPASRPAGVPPEPPLEPIRALFERSGIPVPHRYGASPDGTIELLEDLGDVALADVADPLGKQERHTLYREVCHLIPRIQSISSSQEIPAFERHLDAALFQYKGDLFAEHSFSNLSAAARTCIRDRFAAIARLCEDAPQRLAHRDFQSHNIRVAPGRPGSALVLIDLQGAFLAPPEYDLVCVLRDSYVELPPDTIDDLFNEIRQKLPDAPAPEISALRFDALTVTRKGKDHARFRFTAKQRNDTRFLPHLATTARHLKCAAERVARTDPAFNDLAELIATLEEPE